MSNVLDHQLLQALRSLDACTLANALRAFLAQAQK